MKMRNATISLFLMTVLAGGAMTVTNAQTTKTPAPPTGTTTATTPAKKEHKKLDLGLTKDQKVKMKAIRASYKSKIEAIRQNTTLTPKQKREQLKPILAAELKETNTILTPEQQAKMAEYRKENRRDHGDRKMGKLGAK